MEKITITEALSEVNLIKKKIASKQNRITTALVRATHVADPFESEGGSKAMIKSELQGIHDLNRRLARIRAGISQANLETEITIGEDNRTIHDWAYLEERDCRRAIVFHSSHSRDY